MIQYLPKRLIFSFIGCLKLKLHAEKVPRKEKYELRIYFRVRFFHLWWS